HMTSRPKSAQAPADDRGTRVLDEPVSGMDPQGRGEFLALIRSLAKDHGKHVVWSSHMLPDVQRVADQVLVLVQGRLRGSFRLEDLKAATGRFEVEGEGDPTAFDRAIAARGVVAEARPVRGGVPPAGP